MGKYSARHPVARQTRYAATQITVPLWFRYSGAGIVENMMMRVRFANAIGWMDGVAETVYLPVQKGEWQRLGIKISVPSGATSVGFSCQMQGVSNEAGDTLDATGLLFNRSDTFRRYFDGNTPGCAWLGAPHASPSVGYPPLT